ncbi:MAG: cytochrome d ubiquinol oxidase subunit II [Bacteroidetes bacterium]|nr:cytochrome d ubiquinol oxidase subunit II [Bacteroidota bacterium]
MSYLPVTWFALIGVIFSVYAVLDGFDLGVGFWYLFLPSEKRQLIQNKTGRFWYGNKVWLIAGLCSLFTAFPKAFVSVIGSFQLEFILVIGAIIFKTAAGRLRNIGNNPAWITVCDIVFTVGSICPPFLFGFIAGNILKGIPLGGDGLYSGTFSGLFSFYSVVAGLFVVIMFATQGSLYLAMKTEGMFRKRAVKWAGCSRNIYIVLFLCMAILSVIFKPHISINFILHPLLFLVPMCCLVSIITIRLLLKKEKVFKAFLASTISIIIISATFGISIFPFLVPTFGNMGKDLTIYNSAASEKRLYTLLIIALIGLPVMIVYTAFVYRRAVKAGKDTHNFA